MHHTVPESARRAQPRHPAPPPGLARGAEARPLEGSGLAAKLREGRAAAQDRGNDPGVGHEIRRGSRLVLCRCRPAVFTAAALKDLCPVDACCVESRHEVALNLRRMKQPRHFVSLFGGVANLASSVARIGGVATVVDFARHSNNDIANSRVAEDVSLLIDTADVLGVDLPCCTWSRARRAPVHSSMPSAARSNQYLMGLPD